MKTLTACALSLASLASPALAQDGKTVSLSFGVYQSDKATTMYKSFTPILEHLMSDMETRLERPVDIRLTIFKSYDDGIASLAKGEVDFVRFGPASYITAKVQQPGIELLAMETEKGEKRFKGVVIVAKDSPIQTLADLRGRKFAFGDQNSTIGRYLVQSELFDAGLRMSDLADCCTYLGRHDKVAQAVEAGDFDAGSVQKNSFDKANTNGTLRILKSFDNVTKPWVARKGLDRTTFEAIQQGLFALKDEAILKELKVTGFVTTSDEEYEPVRSGMKKAELFEGKHAGT